MSTATPLSTVDSLYLRAGEEDWPSRRLEVAIACARQLRADAATRGKPCGASYIPRTATCHKGAGALTPATVAAAPRRGTANWQRRAAIAAGVTAGALAVGLPAAAFLEGYDPTGRRASTAIASAAGTFSAAAMSWAGGPLAPIGVPLAMGLKAGEAGMRAATSARSSIEAVRAAPGFARGAAGLASRKAKSAAARESYIEAMKNAWLASNKPISPAEARRRAREVRRVEAQIAELQRQAATRSRAARRAARIARTGSPFRSSPTPSESWLRQGLQRGPITRTPAALTAGGIRALQNTRRGLSARRPKFYSAYTNLGK
jgi:hypothetical protein